MSNQIRLSKAVILARFQRLMSKNTRADATKAFEVVGEMRTGLVSETQSGFFNGHAFPQQGLRRFDALISDPNVRGELELQPNVVPELPLPDVAVRRELFDLPASSAQPFVPIQYFVEPATHFTSRRTPARTSSTDWLTRTPETLRLRARAAAACRKLPVTRGEGQKVSITY